MYKALFAWLMATFLLFSNHLAFAQSEGLQLEVIDPYLEMHTGPGRGYPKFHVVENGEEVHIISRRANWYYVSSGRNKKGWVKLEGLGRTMARNGMPAALPDTDHGDYLAQQLRVGFALGTQEAAETTTIMAGYRLASWLGAEIEYGQIFGKNIDGSSRGANLIFEPIQSWTFTPFISTGYGKQIWTNKEVTSVGSRNSALSDYAFLGAGINYYLGFNFVVRGEYRSLEVMGKNDTVSTSAWRLGFSSFF